MIMLKKKIYILEMVHKTKKMQVEICNDKHKLDENEIVILYSKEDKVAQEIGDIFGCSTTPIYSILKENDVKMRSPGRRNTKVRLNCKNCKNEFLVFRNRMNKSEYYSHR